jgi:cell division protein FtsI (penicillin-binding protein 3)
VPSTNEIKDIDKSLKHHNEQYEQYYSLVQKTDKKVPDLVGMPGMDAIALLENMNVKVRVKGIGKVKRQSLKPGEIIKHNQIILLELS